MGTHYFHDPYNITCIFKPIDVEELRLGLSQQPLVVVVALDTAVAHRRLGRAQEVGEAHR